MMSTSRALALTPDQARLLSRYTSEVILAYDNDAAGQKASQRAIGILERLDLKVRVLRMSGAKDPDEYIQIKGAESFRQLLEGSADQVEYRLTRVREKYDLSQDDQKIAYLQEAAQMIAALPSAVAREVYSGRVAALAGVSPDTVTMETERNRKRLLSKALRTEEQKLRRPEHSAQPASKELRYRDPVSAVAEEGIIRLLFRDPVLLEDISNLKAEDFSSETLGHIYQILCRRIAADESISMSVMAQELTSEEMSLLVSILQKPEQLSSSSKALEDYIRRIREQKELAAGRTDLNALSNKLRERKGYRSNE